MNHSNINTQHLSRQIAVHEVAQLLDCTPETVLDKAAAGQLAAVKFGRSWVFLRDALFEGLKLTALKNLEPKNKPGKLSDTGPTVGQRMLQKQPQRTVRQRVRPVLADMV